MIQASYTLSLELWYPALGLHQCDSNIEVSQRYKNKVLKSIVDSQCYIQNSDIHRDFRIEMVADIIAKFAYSHEKILQSYIISKHPDFSV
jgi:hypothetical protein